MLALPRLPMFSLAAEQMSGRVSCNAQGIFVGDVPLLERFDQAGHWSVRPISILDDELTRCYRLPVDIARKKAALALVTAALNRGDLAMAAIATAQMQFPNPPPCSKAFETYDEITRRAAELWRSGLLKADWDPAKHPRTGTKPNPGWFALKPKPTSVPSVKPRTGWPQRDVNELARDFVRGAAEFIERNEGRILLFGLELSPWIDALVATFTPEELNQGEDRLTAQLQSAFDPPKTLEELQQDQTEDGLGYEQHHIVEQNPSNLTKDILEKFGQELLDDPNNLACVPRFAHEDISALYSSKPFGPGTPTLREILSTLDYEQQRELGLLIMQLCGVLE